MARQTSIMPITGTIDGITYYKNKEHGYLSREKAGPSSAQVKESPSYAGFRSQQNEFGHCSKVCKLIRHTFYPEWKQTRDTMAQQRLNKLLCSILETDTAGIKGERRLFNSDISLLKGFAFCRSMGTDMLIKGEITMDAGTGADFHFFGDDKIIPDYAPSGATHIFIQSAAAYFDLIKGKSAGISRESSAWELSKISGELVGVHSHAPCAEAGHTVLLVVASCLFSQRIAGRDYILSNKHCQRADIVYAGGL